MVDEAVGHRVELSGRARWRAGPWRSATSGGRARQRALEGFAALLPVRARSRDRARAGAVAPDGLRHAVRSVHHAPGERLVRCAGWRSRCRWWGSESRSIPTTVWWDPELDISRSKARRRTHRGVPRLRLAARHARSAFRPRDAGRRDHQSATVRRARRPRPATVAATRSRYSRTDGGERSPDRVVATVVERFPQRDGKPPLPRGRGCWALSLGPRGTPPRVTHACGQSPPREFASRIG